MIWRYCIALFLGAIVGSFAFLSLASFMLGNPVGDTLLSAHGILIRNGQEELTAQQTFEIQQLLKKGMILTADGLISTMQNFYEVLITVLVGLLAALAFFSVVYARWQSRAQIDELVSDRAERGLNELLGKKSFHDIIEKTVNSALQIEMEAIDEPLRRVDEYIASLEELTETTADKSDPEERDTTKTRTGTKRKK